MRKNIVAGNWKMNKNFQEAEALMLQLAEYKKNNKTNCEVYIAPPSLYLTTAKNIFANDEVKVFSQDISEHDKGAYTGEISVEMIKSAGLNGSIVAHSERRQYHNETDSHAAQKVKNLLNAGLTPIYCNGETLEQRKAGQHLDVVKKQTETALFELSAEEINAFIRNLIAEKYGKDTANEISILYGGSVKPDNAKEIFSQPDIDGGLIGGASLKIEDFSKIIEAFN